MEKSRVDQTGAAFRGSQRLIQRYVNEHPGELSCAIALGTHSFPGAACIAWVSPLRVNNYAEYHDSEFLVRVGLGRWASALEEFWPKGGPHWDALAITADNGRRGHSA